LQGASLYQAELQGADLTAAHLQGASLVLARLQGALLLATELQDAELWQPFVWRMALAWVSVEHTRIVRPDPDYPCTEGKCGWARKYYEVQKAKVEAVPPGEPRELALERIKPLGEEPFTVDEKAAKGWDALEKASKTMAAIYPARLAETLIKTGCNERGAPYVIRGLLRQLDQRFQDDDDQPQKAKVAKAFLEPGCEGARGLSDQENAELRRLAASPTRPRRRAVQSGARRDN
jgi:uncharacterized protein YjbI with pentapeptide repeats